MTVLLALTLTGALAPGSALTQQAPSPKFEVASVKRTDPGDPRTMFDWQPGRFRAVGVTVNALICAAFDIQLTQVSGGPAWLDSDRFDIDAKPESVAGVAGYPQMRLMVQSLLKDRFKLVVHFETRPAPVYELVVTKGGAKLKKAIDNAVPPRQQLGRGQLIASATPVSQVIPLLSLLAKRQVVDKTGLTGVYDFTLTYALDASQIAAAGPNAPAPVDPNAPSIFTALQEQLGLKLESAQGPVDVLVVDRAEKPDAD